ncbi:hypothetical protein UlMin_032377 [Ulmus minor]
MDDDDDPKTRDINLDLSLGLPSPEENPPSVQSIPSSSSLPPRPSSAPPPPSQSEQPLNKKIRVEPVSHIDLSQPVNYIYQRELSGWERSWNNREQQLGARWRRYRSTFHHIRQREISSMPPPPTPMLSLPPQPPPTPPPPPRQIPQREISPPFPWAKNLRAKVLDWKNLKELGIEEITGQVKCRQCDMQYEMSYDLQKEFRRVGSFILRHKREFLDRAADVWTNPVYPSCNYCGKQNSARPVIANKKRAINWLFLLLGELIGCCNINQLKYFCKHNEIHRTAAKDRLLFLTYLKLCKQLDPDGPFDREDG